MALIADKATNDPIAASWANTIRNQTVQVTTSSLRPGSPTEGMTIYETDTDRLMTYNGSGWVPVAAVGADTPFTAAFLSSGVTARTGTTNWASYRKVGRHLTMAVHWVCTVNYGSSGSWSVQIPASLVAAGIAGLAVGGGYLFDGSVNKRVTAILGSSTTIAFIADDASTGSYAGALNSSYTVSFTAELETTT